MQDGREKTSHASMWDGGNWCSFIFAEAKPDRLGLLTYITDLGLLHDGKYTRWSFLDSILTAFWQTNQSK